MAAKNKLPALLTGLALALAQGLLAPSLGFSALRLNKTTAAAYAARDARAAAVINGGDRVKATGCHAVAGGAFRCQITLIPAHSRSRCHWTDTIRIVRGKLVITYSRAGCSD